MCNSWNEYNDFFFRQFDCDRSGREVRSDHSQTARRRARLMPSCISKSLASIAFGIYMAAGGHHIISFNYYQMITTLPADRP